MLFSGTIVDGDHLLDLWLYQKHRRPGETLMDVFDAHTWVRTIIPFHAVELLIFLCAMVFVGSQPWIWCGVLLGYGVHLFMDQVGNNSYPFTYSLTYRIYRGFDARYLWTDSCPQTVESSSPAG